MLGLSIKEKIVLQLAVITAVHRPGLCVVYSRAGIDGQLE
jgi:hypothetical protein